VHARHGALVGGHCVIADNVFLSGNAAITSTAASAPGISERAIGDYRIFPVHHPAADRVVMA